RGRWCEDSSLDAAGKVTFCFGECRTAARGIEPALECRTAARGIEPALECRTAARGIEPALQCRTAARGVEPALQRPYFMKKGPLKILSGLERPYLGAPEDCNRLQLEIASLQSG